MTVNGAKPEVLQVLAARQSDAAWRRYSAGGAGFAINAGDYLWGGADAPAVSYRYSGVPGFWAVSEYSGTLAQLVPSREQPLPLPGGNFGAYLRISGPAVWEATGDGRLMLDRQGYGYARCVAESTLSGDEGEADQQFCYFTDAEGNAVGAERVRAVLDEESCGASRLECEVVVAVDAPRGDPLASGAYTLRAASGSVAAETSFGVAGDPGADGITIRLDEPGGIGTRFGADITVLDAAGEPVADGTEVGGSVERRGRAPAAVQRISAGTQRTANGRAAASFVVIGREVSTIKVSAGGASTLAVADTRGPRWRTRRARRRDSADGKPIRTRLGAGAARPRLRRCCAMSGATGSSSGTGRAGCATRRSTGGPFRAASTT